MAERNLSHLEAAHGVVGHTHLSPIKVGDSGSSLPQCCPLGASELQPPPRAGRARAQLKVEEGWDWGAWGLGSLGLGERVFGGGAGNTLFLQRRNRGQAVGVGVELKARMCAHVCACLRVCLLTC